MQISTFSAYLGLGSELVDCHRDATSVPYGHLLVDVSQRTDDRLRYCTKNGSIPSKFYIPDRLTSSNFLDDEHTKSLYSPGVPIIFPKTQKSFRSVLPKRVYQVPLRLYNKSSQRKPAKQRKGITYQIFKTIISCFSKKSPGNKKETFRHPKKCYTS